MLRNPEGIPPHSPEYLKRHVTKSENNNPDLGFGKCLFDGVWKYGLPFAAVITVFSKFQENKGNLNSPIQSGSGSAPVSVIKFLGRVVIGTMMYFPFCLNEKILEMHRKKLQVQLLESSSDSDSDFSLDSYQSNDSRSNFSHLNLDLSLPPTDELILEDSDEEKKTAFTTSYEELRKKHRESVKSYYDNFFKSAAPKSSSPISQPSEKAFTPKKTAIKNKYGDEIET